MHGIKMTPGQLTWTLTSADLIKVMAHRTYSDERLKTYTSDTARLTAMKKSATAVDVTVNKAVVQVYVSGSATIERLIVRIEKGQVSLDATLTPAVINSLHALGILGALSILTKELASTFSKEVGEVTVMSQHRLTVESPETGVVFTT